MHPSRSRQACAYSETRVLRGCIGRLYQIVKEGARGSFRPSKLASATQEAAAVTDHLAAASLVPSKIHYARCLANNSRKSAAPPSVLRTLPPLAVLLVVAQEDVRECHFPLRVAGVLPCICMRKLFLERHLEPETLTVSKR